MFEPFKNLYLYRKIQAGETTEDIWSHLLPKARSGQNLCKTCQVCDLQLGKKPPNPLLMFDKASWKYFPFSSCPLPSPQLWCFASVFKIGFCPVAFPPVCKQRYP